MVYLATDKQTYADLSITETANNEQFLFSLFSKTETKEGKSLMMNWIMYPLNDLNIIWLIATRSGKHTSYCHVLLS